MIDVRHKNNICKTNLCGLRTKNNKYVGYCLRCYIYTFPNNKVSQNYKTKEIAVVDFVKTQYPDLYWIADKTIQGGSSKKRPDLLVDIGSQVLIIEIDESAHNKYDCICENKRIMELSQDLNHKPIVLIRFNPDSYCDNENKTISSCWGYNTKNICIIKKQNEWSLRLNILNDQIKYWLNPINLTSKTIETVQLFYDGFIS